jgi:hypothetical protein
MSSRGASLKALRKSQKSVMLPLIFRSGLARVISMPSKWHEVVPEVCHHQDFSVDALNSPACM